MKYTILLAEDNYLIRKGLKKIILNMTGAFDVAFEASNGEEALALLQAHHIDLVITDVKMPQMDGITLIKQIAERYPDISVIMLSSYNDYEYVRQSLKSGAMDYLLKPVEKNELKNLLDKFLLSRRPVDFYGNGNFEYAVIDGQPTDLLSGLTRDLHHAVETANDALICQSLDAIGAYVKRARLEPPIAKSIFINLYMEFEDFYQERTNMVMDTSSYARHINTPDTLEEVLVYCRAFYTELAHSAVEVVAHTETPIIQVVKRYIAEHYHEQITLSALSEISYTSPSYLCSHFKAKTGQNIMDYVNAVRMEHAKELLKDISLKTYQIADRVGFKDPTYFSRVFKSVVGISPSEYRNRFFSS